MGVMFSRIGYSSDNFAQFNASDFGEKPDAKLIQQLVAAYSQPLPDRMEIREFEKKHSIMFPLDYIQFLEQVNGGYPEKTFIFGFGDLAVTVFYAFNCPYLEDSVNTLFERSMTVEDLPKNQLLPIAGLSNEHQLMMRIADRKFNEIFEVSFNKELRIFENRYIADSFSELVSQLVTEPA